MVVFLCVIILMLVACSPDQKLLQPTLTPALNTGVTAATLQSGLSLPNSGFSPERQVYSNPTYGFSLEHPADIIIAVTDSAQSAGRIGQQAEFAVTINDPLACQLDCPVITSVEEGKSIGGLTARVAHGHLPADDPQGQLEFVSYLYEMNGLFYRFTIYALPFDQINPNPGQIEAVKPGQLEEFIEMLSSLKIEPPLAVLTTAHPPGAASPPSQPSLLAPIGKYSPGDEPLFIALNMIDPAIGWSIAGISPLDQHILRTQDGGRTWRDVTPPEPASDFGSTSKTALAFFLDQSSAWVTFSPRNQPIFTPPLIWYTHDGGQTWNISQPLEKNVADTVWMAQNMYFLDRRKGWLAYSHGQTDSQSYVSIYHTNDGGVSWQAISGPTAQNNAALAYSNQTELGFLDPQIGMAVSTGFQDSKPGVTWTHDGGVTWASQELPPADPGLFQRAVCYPESVSFLPSTTVKLVVTCQNPDNPEGPTISYLYTASTPGMSWSYLSLPAPMQAAGDWQKNMRKTAVLFLEPTMGWLFQYDDYEFSDSQLNVHSTLISTSEDGGSSWSQAATVYWSGQFSFVNPHTGWALAQSEQTTALVQSIDGGKNWELIDPVIIP